MRPAGVGTLRIEVSGEINLELADLVERALAAYPSHTAEVDIDTGGGRWDASLSIFTNLANHARLVTAHIRRAASGGALIAMTADVRQMDPCGSFYLHWPNSAYGATAAELDAVANAKAALMAGRCQVPAARFLRWMKETTTIDAKRALSYGLATQVPGLSKPKLPVVFI